MWPERARTAAKALNSEREPSDESLAVELLSDIRVVFAARKADRLWTTDLLEALHRLEEAPWDDLFGRPLKAQGLAGHLRTFCVSSRDVRIGSIHLPNQLPPGDRRQTRVTMCHERSFLPLVLATHTAAGGAPHLQQPT